MFIMAKIVGAARALSSEETSSQDLWPRINSKRKEVIHLIKTSRSADSNAVLFFAASAAIS